MSEPMHRDNLLVELFVEELPPKALARLGESFASVLAASLKAQGLAPADAAVTPYASPRRLAMHVAGVAGKAPDKAVQVKLLPVSVGLDAQGNATPALLKKLLGLNLGPDAVPALVRRQEGKAETLFVDTVVPGATLAEGLQKALDEALAKLPIPKVMTYQLDDGWSSVNFVRPAHGLVALHGEAVVRADALGLTAGRTTRGHRFEAQVDPVQLRHADSYAQQLLEEGGVIAGFAARRDELARQLREAADREGLVAVDDPALLDEVAALVERPNVLLCRFETEFLDVPPECLILTMKANQKYFPLLDREGRLTEKFLVASNIRPADASRVVQGNERVVRPRLADAKFFFDQDRKKRLEDRVAGLDKVVYHGKLGSQGERVARVRAIAKAVAAQLGVDGQAVDTAARLAKADLLTDMVGEFPELQGVMGGYYARHDGLAPAVAEAIEDHYRPRFAGDALPRGDVGTVVALADKLETLVGLFGIGQVPTGDKDPFALRRHALGVVRLLSERRLPLALSAVLPPAAQAFGERIRFDLAVLREFFAERAITYFVDRGFSRAQVEAALAVEHDRFDRMEPRLDAVRAFAHLPEAGSLAAANKRVGNILKKTEGAVEARVDAGLLKEPAEGALANALKDVAPQADAAFERGDYTASLQALAALKGPVDAFFDDVMVNVEDAALRMNRLGLLATLHRAMNRVADLSKLAV